MLARAAYFDREFIFLDNSLSALDAENYRRILEVFILKNWKTKRVVLASNDSEIQKHAVATVDFDKAGLGGVGDHG
jgi:ABC-type lipoprotein export system ATPase subunit